MIFYKFLPKHLASRLAGAFANCTWPWLKKWLIRQTVKTYQVDLSDAIKTETEFTSFNDFFTRQLKPGARPIDQNKNSLVSPADGEILSFGSIENNQLLQAKNHTFSVDSLLAESRLANNFHHGHYVTIYLSPRDYHRVHLPFDGTLTHMTTVPGNLHSVSPKYCAQIPQLFAKNERVITHFETTLGPIAMALVGACLVGSIHTKWAGQVVPSKNNWVDQMQNVDPLLAYQKGEEIGHFAFGSTVILLLPSDLLFAWSKTLQVGSKIKMGQVLGHRIVPSNKV